ncbi:MAG TPA: hypothetical protein VFR47_32170 [Anaerolineales bacterium]|nr:hypothetical protein [Anaerolineales bacterium]
MKTVSIFLSLINSLLAGVILLASLTGNELHEATLLWLLIKVFAALGIILTGVLTWIAILSAVRPGLLALSNLSLVALGAATAVWTLHLAIVTGDMEYYMVLYGGSLMMQGAASLFGFAEESRNVGAV